MIRRATWKRRDPAGNGAGAEQLADDSHSTTTIAEAIHRLRLARLAHHADPAVAATAATAICELRQRERLGALGGGR